MSSEDYAGKRLIMFFYPKAMTPGCTAEACDFATLRRPPRRGYEIVGVLTLGAQRQVPRGRPALPSCRTRTTRSPSPRGVGKKKNYGKEYEGIIRSTFW